MHTRPNLLKIGFELFGDTMSFILHSAAVQTAPWSYRDVKLIDIAYNSNNITDQGVLDIDCYGCCCLKSRPLCYISKPLFDLDNDALLTQNNILTREEYNEAMMDFSYALMKPMCWCPCYCISSILYVIPGVMCICGCLQRCESFCILNSLAETMKTLNEKHRRKQVKWEIQYQKPRHCFSCCLPLNYFSLKAIASLPLVEPARSPPPPAAPQAVNVAAMGAPAIPVANPILAHAEMVREAPPAPLKPQKSLAQDLKELAQLRDEGIITEEDFVAAKQKLLR